MKTFVERAQAQGVPPCSRVDQTLSSDERDLYQGLRRMHCAQKKGNHACRGSVTIGPRSLLLSCELCGEVRANYP